MGEEEAEEEVEVERAGEINSGPANPRFRVSAKSHSTGGEATADDTAVALSAMRIVAVATAADAVDGAGGEVVADAVAVDAKFQFIFCC